VTLVALLRGINVGGRRKVPMADLRALCDGLGLRRTRTYIQSGNVAFDTDAEPAVVSARLATAMEERFGFPIPVVLRSAAELEGTLARVPFEDLERVHVAFLDRAPGAEAVASLDPDRSPGDRVVVVGADAYLHLPNGMGRTKLTNDWIDRKLGVVSTARNWRTVEALAALATG
jgi:uncharacterized protein (DUF1697 family)